MRATKREFLAGVAGMVALAGLPGRSLAAFPTSAKVGTASQGGTYFIYGAGWAQLVQEMTKVNMSSEVTGGPVQNMALVDAGDLEFGMVTMGPAYDGWIGESELAPGVELREVRALFPMYQTPFQMIALESSGIKSSADLNGKTVGVGPRGGTPGSFFPRFFEDLGIEASIQYGGANDLAGQLKDGLLDCFAFAAGIPISAFSEIEAERKATIFTFEPPEIGALLEKYPSLSPFEVPGGTYKGQPNAQTTVSMWNFAIANKNVDEEFCYEIMKIVLENNDRMMQIHKSAEETKLENWDKNQFLWFHPGAVRYLRDKGVQVPEALIPPEMS